jgi:hypothetical protein
MVELTAKAVIDAAHQRVPASRTISNARLGRAVWTYLRPRGGEKVRKDRYPLDPHNAQSPRSGQRYRVPASIVSRGLERLAGDVVATVGRRGGYM